MKRAALLLLLGLLGGCVERVCTLDLRWGLRVEVTDTETGLPINASVVIRDGDYVEALVRVGTHHVGAGERPGTYGIDIIAEGYVPQALERVEVDMGHDGCHVETRDIDVALAR